MVKIGKSVFQIDKKTFYIDVEILQILQSRLPDINTAYITYRREVLTNLRSEKYSAVFGSLDALNGMLPDKYWVEISTQKYEQEMKNRQKLLAVCSGCTERMERGSIQPREVLIAYGQGLLSGQKTVKVWQCPKCKHENELAYTKFVATVIKKPYFLQVVPEPPKRRDGLLTKISYKEKITSWVWQFLDEIEHQLAEFRDDNWQKTNEYGDDDNDEYDAGEENE